MREGDHCHEHGVRKKGNQLFECGVYSLTPSDVSNEELSPADKSMCCLLMKSSLVMKLSG